MSSSAADSRSKLTIESLSLGELTKLYRERRGFNQRELAQSLQQDPTLVSRWERGLRYPSLVNVQAITQALDLSPVEQQNLINALDYDVAEYLALHELLSLYLDRSRLTENQVAQRLQVGRDKVRSWRRGATIPTNADIESIIQQVSLGQEQAAKLRQAKPHLRFPAEVLQFIFSSNRNILEEQIAELIPRGVTVGTL